ncbi:MAG: hypothetical protein IKY82_00765 [Alistipes sp.]|nr:hypothetical protein [Alistipes sp.]
MLRIIISLLVALSVGLTACHGQRDGVYIAVGNRPSHIVEPPSVEYDPHFWSQNIVMRGIDPAAWDMVCERVEKMGLKRMRVMAMPAWWEPINDNDDPNKIAWEALTLQSVEMQSLYKTLDLAERCGIDITLTMWGCHRYCGAIIDERYRSSDIYFLAKSNSTNDWCVPSKDMDEWAESTSALLQYLILQKKYTCIKAITLMNEPSWSYRIDGELDYEHYVEMCHLLNDRLERDGLRNKLLFNLSDDAEHIGFLRKAVSSANDISDCYNSHTYKFGYETPNSEIEAWERANIEVVRPTGKRHYIGEFGSNQTVGASRQRDIDLYERGVLMSRIALSLMNAGAAGVSYWSLLDEYYAFTDSYGSMQQLGLWRSAKSEYSSEPYFDDIECDFELRPQYWAYSLLTRHIGRSEIFPLQTNDEFVAASAFRGMDGRWVYVIANASQEEYKAIIENSVAEGKRFDRYAYERETLPTNEEMIASNSTQKARKGRVNITAAPQSVVLYVEK